jgi:glyoxylase-like metal-dependent hydrolase (beta-lactamase superfamily II)
MSVLGLRESEVRDSLCFPWSEPPQPGHTLEVAPGVLWLRMPLPFSLDHINLYLLRHEHGWVVVDTGLNTPQSRQVWESVFNEVFAGAPVLAVIVTHFHYDHSGLFGWLVDRFRCPAYMSFGEYQAMFVTPSGADEPNWAFSQFYQRCGLSDEQITEFRPMLSKMSYDIDAPTSFHRLRENDLLKIGNRCWRIVVGSGHSPEHACLYSEDDQLLIAGDQILPRITSSVCVNVTEPEANPLGEWLASLRRFRNLPDSVLVLPAHERPFRGLHHRLGQLQQHHDVHLEAIVTALDRPKTVAELRPTLFPKIRSSFDLLMAIGETLAHINFLRDEGVLIRTLDGKAWRFGLSSSGGEAFTAAEDIHV